MENMCLDLSLNSDKDIQAQKKRSTNIFFLAHQKPHEVYDTTFYRL